MYHNPLVWRSWWVHMYHNAGRVPQSRRAVRSARTGPSPTAIPGVSAPDAGRPVPVEITVTSVGADGTVRRARVDTAGRVDADWWERMAASAHLEVPPPYQPEPGQPVYEVRVGGRVAQVAEGNLVGPLRELVTAVLAEGGDGG
jgi:hypothetical protein